MLKNKNAQIGTTLTWVGAFFIIFIILTLFFIISLLLSDKNSILKFFESKNKLVASQDYRLNLKTDISFNEIYSINPNYPKEDETKIKNIIK